jgi:hypothetical protein
MPPTELEEVEALVAEILAMCARDPWPGTELYAALLQGDKPRAHAIGERLHAMGGHRLMLLVHERIEREAPPYSARHLEIAWDGVGGWCS